MTQAKRTALDVAAEYWGEGMPDWVRVLATQCMRPGQSQASVARAIDRSPAVISQILKNSYAASTARLEERIRGEFMNSNVECPHQGQIKVSACQDWRDKSKIYVSASPLRVQMRRACLNCPRNQKGEEA